MKETFFITTAIDYPSAKPHIGHALEKIQADVIARYKRSQGFDVHFSIGTDEHGLKIQRYAKKAGKTPKEFVDEMSGHFAILWEKLNISHDDFIRTTEQRHEKVAQELLKKIYDNGDLYKGNYKGLYCVDCETFYLPKDLDENRGCPVHHRPVEEMQEEAYFFRMSKYHKQILEHIQENKNFIIPEARRNGILERLKEPVEDLSISRSADIWGVPFPIDQKFSIFVWVEALMNYLTTIDYPNKKFKEFWPANVHVIGKDIVWHHSVIWGSVLLSLGLPLPKTLFVHGFITVDGQKMSKSIGNVIDPFGLVEKYGTDAVRYFFLREIPPTEDGDFSFEKFETRYNADLASGLGNLVARTLALAKKQQSTINNQQFNNSDFQKLVDETKKNVDESLEEFRFNDALMAIWDIIHACDKYVDEKRPWQATEGQKAVIADLLLAISDIAELIQPFLPETAQKIQQQLQGGEAKALFPRLESRKIDTREF
ncbi:MAG TPA: methionine--tRNA ligase [Candidatus Paceibacterota bacterium]